jgi:hypothetical protein
MPSLHSLSRDHWWWTGFDYCGEHSDLTRPDMSVNLGARSRRKVTSIINKGETKPGHFGHCECGGAQSCSDAKKFSGWIRGSVSGCIAAVSQAGPARRSAWLSSPDPTSDGYAEQLDQLTTQTWCVPAHAISRCVANAVNGIVRRDFHQNGVSDAGRNGRRAAATRYCVER